MKQKAKVLVTGASGQLGRTLQDLYAGNHSNFDLVFASKDDLDITNREHIALLFDQDKFDYCINCAAYTDVEQAEKTPNIAFEVNAEGPLNLAQACRDNNTVLIHVSTDYVFDGKKGEAYHEGDYANPINAYGKSKLAGENNIKNVLDSYFILRTSWLYSRYGKNFYTTICKLAETRKEIGVIGDQTGTPTACIDLAYAILELIENEVTAYGLYHYSNAGKATWHEFASAIISQKEFKVKLNEIKSTDYPSLAKRPPNTVLDKSKIRDILKNDIPSWRMSLKKLIEEDSSGPV